MNKKPYDLSQLAGLTYGQLIFKLRRDLEFAMPPLGTVKHRTKISGQNWFKYSWRCEVDNCWYVCSPSSESNLADIQAYHARECPSPPRRESLPSGLSEIQKLWREIDDVISALKSNTKYRGMTGVELKAYAMGISFSIVMKETPLFPDARAVAAEGVRRYDMSQGKLPFASTPTRFAVDHSSLGTPGGWQPDPEDVPYFKPQSARKDAGKAASPKTASANTVTAKTTAPKKQTAKLSEETMQAIKNALLSGMFSKEDIETMYSVNLSELGLSVS